MCWNVSTGTPICILMKKAPAATKKEWAPWYAIPADDKLYMQYCAADIIVHSLKSLGLAYPRVDAEQEKKLLKIRKMLEKDD
jgi:hypothetical protein